MTPRQPRRLMTEEENLAYMAKRLVEVEELMRGRPHRQERRLFKDTD